MAKLIQYNPNPKEWEGYVSINVPDYETRMNYRHEYAKLEDNVEIVKLSRRIAKDHVQEVCLKHIETGEEVCSFDELDFLHEADEVHGSVALACTRGPKLGNVLRPTSA